MFEDVPGKRRVLEGFPFFCLGFWATFPLRWNLGVEDWMICEVGPSPFGMLDPGRLWATAGVAFFGTTAVRAGFIHTVAKDTGAKLEGNRSNLPHPT